MRMDAICVLLVLGSVSFAPRGAAGGWQMHMPDGSVMQLQAADSVVAIQFAVTIDSAAFAHQRPELRDTYVPWNLGDGFYVFGVEPGLDIATVLVQLRSDPLVRMANPVMQVDSTAVYWMTDLLAVQFRHATSPAQIDSVNALLAAYVNPPDSDKPLLYWVRARPNLGLSTLEVADAYYATGLCLYAQPDFTWRAQFGLFHQEEPAPEPLANPDSVLPDVDPFYGNQWHWYNHGQNGGADDADVDADSAWFITKGNPAVRVAVLDIGFQTNHEDADTLTPIFTYDQAGWFRYWVEPDNDVGINCNIGTVHEVEGCGHGTSVLGILAAAHDNPLGLKGLAPGCTYWLIKVFDDDGWTRDSILTAALRFAWKTARCQIVSNSWYWYYPYAPMTAELQEMRDSGVATFFCAGNYSAIWYPAMLPTVMAIGATNRFDTVCPLSGRGPALDFVAPGHQLWTWDMMGQDGYVPTYASCEENWNYHCSFWGTSAAAPIAAGVAALVLSLRPDFMDSTDRVGILRRILESSAEDKGPVGWDSAYGWGRVNAYHALLAACNCPHQGDVDTVNSPGEVDISDVIQEIAIAFSGGLDIRDSGCPASRGDVCYDSFVDVYDVVQIIAIAFSGGSVCNPCTPSVPAGCP